MDGVKRNHPSGFHLVFILVFVLAGLSPAAVAQQVQTPPDQRVLVGTARPRVALVLSGGGARGFAHIGVLRALREMKVPVDIVVGTSMGCVVGGAFAAGQSIEELEKMARTTDWDLVVADRPPRNQLTFRRREEDIALPTRIEFGVDRHGLTLPPATAGNGALEQALMRLLPPGTHDLPANRLALPFRSVASDLLTGELVELSDVSLFMTIRASLSVPGVFAPVRVKGRLLVDGGLVRNLPVDFARALGADIVIAVNVGTPLAGESALGSSLGVAQQMINILTEQNVQSSLKELRPHDILISPDLTGVTFLDFNAHERAMQAGADAVQRVAASLQALVVSPELYAAKENTRLHVGPAQTSDALPLASIQVEGTKRINPAMIAAQMRLPMGESVTSEEVRQAASRIYGRADVGRVTTDIKDTEGQRNVTLRITEDDWARSRLRLGLQLTSDFSDNSTYSLVAMHVVPSLNDWGAELRTIGRIGTQRSIATEWWQPLGAGSDWHLAPTAAYGALATDVFASGRRTSRVGVQGTQFALALGRQFSDWGDLRVGLVRNGQDTELLVPEDPRKPIERVKDTSQFLQLRIDTLEPIAFPVAGQFVNAIVKKPIRRNAKDDASWHSQLSALSAFKFGNWGGHVYGEWAHSQDGSLQVDGSQPLGGFLRLSGTDQLSISGDSIVFGRVVLARRIGNLSAALGGAIRTGFSLELGGGFAKDEAVQFSNLKKAASAFISVDTRFGPFYIAAGGTRGAGGTLYLFLGPIW